MKVLIEKTYRYNENNINENILKKGTIAEFDSYFRDNLYWVIANGSRYLVSKDDILFLSKKSS